MRDYVFISGSNGGIGREMVRAFAGAGYNLVVNARQESEDFNKFMDDVRDEFEIDVVPSFFDVTDYESVKESIKQLYKSNINIEVLINCVGMAGGNLLAITPIATIREIFDVNLFSYMELTQLVMKGMIRRRRGCIINMASFEGIRLYPGNSGYGVSKAAVIAWTQVMAKELGDLGIRVNAIAPGFVDTRMARNTNDEERNRIIGESAIKRMADPKEISAVAVFLASEKASFISGEVVRVDGGMI